VDQSAWTRCLVSDLVLTGAYLAGLRIILIVALVLTLLGFVGAVSKQQL